MSNAALRYSLLALVLWLPLQQSMAADKAEGSAKAAVEKLIQQDERPDPATAVQLAKSGAVLVDVRSAEEWADGHAKGALFMPWRSIKDEAPKQIADKDTPIITYCAIGMRAKFAASSLRELGYTHVLAMKDGFDEIKAAGYAAESTVPPSK
jgi:rhodanese-related sulfurtransferase